MGASHDSAMESVVMRGLILSVTRVACMQAQLKCLVK